MKRINYLILLLICCLTALAGCQGQRTTPSALPVVQPTEPAMPVPPGPTDEKPEGTHIIKPEQSGRAELPVEDEHALVCSAKLDLLRVLVCSDETVHLSDETYKSDECRQKVVEHFSNMGYRVVDGAYPGYDVSGGALSEIANKRNVDLFVLLKADVKQWDKLGDFYVFEADVRGRVAQIVGDELVTATSAYLHGKRALSEQKAAQSALQACAKEIGQKLSYEILRKSSTGILVRKLVIDGLERSEQVDYVKVGLLKKSGIQSVERTSWDEKNRRGVFLIRLDASAKEHLAAYLEQIDNVRLEVKRLEKTEVKSRKKKFLGIF